jgi:hypothetical protein
LGNTFVTENTKNMCVHNKKLLALFTNAVADAGVTELRMKGEQRFTNSGKILGGEGLFISM